MNTDIVRSFDRHANEYDAHARMQRGCAERLDMYLGDFMARSDNAAPVRRVIDLGCGTGALTLLLAKRFPAAAIASCDLSPAMLKKTCAAFHAQESAASQSRFATHLIDAEYATFSPPPDVIASNLCMQWFVDPMQSLAHHARRARYIAFSTLLDGTFASWIAEHEARGVPHGVRPFLGLSEIAQVSQRLNAVRVQLMLEKTHESHPDALTFLRELRAIGATTPRLGYRPTPLRTIVRAFADGFTAEYHIGYVLIERSCASS